jgi:hypothetical protein
LLGAADARAEPFYIEAGAGIGSIWAGATPTLPNTTPTTGTNMAIGFGTFYNFLGPYDPFQIHVGIKSVALAILDGAAHRTIMGLYPCFRFETPRLYFTIGLSPWIFTNNGTGWMALGYLTPVPSVLSYYGEFGLLWRTTEYFHFSLEANAHFVQTSTVMSPGPEITFLFNMRFIFPYTTSKEGAGKGAKPDGWRYPFGIRI